VKVKENENSSSQIACYHTLSQHITFYNDKTFVPNLSRPLAADDAPPYNMQY